MLSDGAAIPDESVGFCLHRKGKKMNIAYNMDCMEAMRKMPDKCFDLAVVDPPYGIGEKFKGGKTGKINFNEIVEKGWDVAPSKNYFAELFRVSKNQVIFGGNYFELPATRCFICWDKTIPEDFSLAMCEYAWTSFDENAKIIRIQNRVEQKIHPTQKPVSLYAWIFQHYAKTGDKILDTHLGSGSSRIAAYDAGLDFVGYEIDKDYFDRQEERYNTHASQMNLFFD